MKKAFLTLGKLLGLLIVLFVVAVTLVSIGPLSNHSLFSLDDASTDSKSEDSSESSASSVCGNSILEGDEECERGSEYLCNSLEEKVGIGYENTKRICRVDEQNNDCRCVFEFTCGDGEFDSSLEQCDLTASDGDTCGVAEECRACECNKILCGDGILSPGEQCEVHRDCPIGELCTSSCLCFPRVPPGIFFCGDEKVDQSEECDDGNVLDGDGCSSSCLIESIEELQESSQEEELVTQTLLEGVRALTPEELCLEGNLNVYCEGLAECSGSTKVTLFEGASSQGQVSSNLCGQCNAAFSISNPESTAVSCNVFYSFIKEQDESCGHCMSTQEFLT